MTRDSRQSQFYKISAFLMDKPSLFAHKEISIFGFSDDQDWWKFSVFFVYSCYAAFKNQVSLICIEEDLRLCFH